MKGVVDKIWENETKDGRKYWVLSIDGEKYSVWDPKYIEGLQEGDVVDYQIRKSGNFKQIKELVVLEHEPESQLVVENEYKNRQIARMACLKYATTMLTGTEMSPEEMGQTALNMAKEFEKYVLGDGDEEPLPF